MVEKLTQERVWQFIELGDEDFDLESLRARHEISAESSAFYTAITRLVTEKKIKRLGRGRYHRIKPIKPVQIFGTERERRPPFELIFPRDYNTMMEMDFAEHVVVREGDLILVSGVSNFGKTCIALNFCGENIDKNPVLMGNEYTNPEAEPLPRFLSRLDNMDVRNGGWINWVDDKGNDKFTLLPVREDFAEHVIKDRNNIIDWINIETGEHYMIGTVLDGIKRAVGRGVIIAVIQKAEGADAGRGGQFTKDFADLELLIDKLGDDEVLLTVGKCKESTKQVVGKTYGYSIVSGVKIINFREVKKCSGCRGQGYYKGEPCGECHGKKWLDK